MDHTQRTTPTPSPTCIALAFAALAFAAPATAFQFSYQQPYTLQFDHPLTPASYVTGDAKAVVLGHLDEDAIPDACVLHDTQAYLIRSADRRNHWRKLAGNYTAITRLPAGQAGVRDAVLAVNANGLVRLVWDGAPGQQTLVPIAVPFTSAWVGCTNLQVNETPGGSLEILALGSDDRTLLRAIFTPATGVVGSFDSCTLNDLATALTALELSSDGELEYAYAGSWGVRFLTSDLLDHPEMPPIDEACNRSLLVRLPVAGETVDRLAWIRAPVGTADFLTVLRADGNHDVPIYLIGASIAQATLADMCEDARPELMLFADASPYAIGLRRDTSKTFRDLSVTPFILDLDRQHTLVSTIGPYAFQAGSGVLGGTDKAPVPAAMDMDGDSDDDLFLAGHAGPNGSSRAMVVLGSLVKEEEAMHGSPTIVRAWLPGFNFTTYPAVDEALIEFAVAERPLAGPAFTATHVRYTIWVQAETALCMDLASEQSLTFDLTPNGIPQYPGLYISDLASLGNGWIHIQSEFLRYENGVMIDAFPAYHEKLALSWFVAEQPVEFRGGTAGVWTHDPLTGNDGGIGGTSGRPPSTPPSGGGG
jgi:hypothetical protein